MLFVSVGVRLSSSATGSLLNASMTSAVAGMKTREFEGHAVTFALLYDMQYRMMSFVPKPN